MWHPLLLVILVDIIYLSLSLFDTNVLDVECMFWCFELVSRFLYRGLI